MEDMILFKVVIGNNVSYIQDYHRCEYILIEKSNKDVIKNLNLIADLYVNLIDDGYDCEHIHRIEECRNLHFIPKG
jgi:hypothetical protein